jgi:hypothetical protein
MTWAAVPPPRWARLRIRRPAAYAVDNATARAAGGPAELEWRLWPSWEWGLDRCVCQVMLDAAGSA